MNSFYILLAFLGFTAFGYLSLIRLLYKSEMTRNVSPLKQWRESFRAVGLLPAIARSAAFIGLPSVGLLLFWGWGPALLWLVVAHLLIDTPANFIAVKMFTQVDVASHFTEYERAAGALRALLYQTVLLLIITLLLTLLANLLDQQTGLLFALIGVLISLHLLRSATSAANAIFKLIASIGLLVLGLSLANTMGIAVFGSFSPIPEQAAWLKFDNRSLLAVLLLVAAVRLSQTDSLQLGLSKVVGGVVLTLLALMVFKLSWQQPLLDAPVLSAGAQEPALPAFTALFLFLSPAMLLLLMQLTNYSDMPEPDDKDKEDSEESRFLSAQCANLVCLMLSVALVLWLATANGIGAWNTHYTVWPDGVTLQAHFALVMRSLAVASGASVTGNALMPTLLVTGICLFGTASLIYFLAKLRRQADDANSQDSSLFSVLIGKLSGQYLAVILLSMWVLTHGIGVHLWLWIMALCWLLSTDMLLEYASFLEHATLTDNVRRIFPLILLTVGILQLLWSGLSAIAAGNPVNAAACLFVLLLSALLCSKSAIQCVRGLQLKEEDNLF